MTSPLLKFLNNAAKPAKQVTLTGNQNLALKDVIIVANSSPAVNLKPTTKVKKRSQKVLESMRAQIKSGTPIYGVTSAYGGRAGRVLNKGEVKQRLENSEKLSESIIHVDVSTGPPIPTPVTRAALLLRINMLLPGYSAVRLETLQKITGLLNHQLTPVVGQYGTLGASGDLAHNGRVVATLLHKDTAQVETKKGELVPAPKALKEAGIEKVKLDPKEGLGLVNGDNFSTAAALMQLHETTHLFTLNLMTAALTIQALQGSNRNFHPLLSTVRPHKGQVFTAKLLLHLLKESQLSFQELQKVKPRKNGEIIQDFYSIRCLPQYYGPDWEALEQILETIHINANSVSDNPLWTTPDTTTNGEEPYQWVSGGNFLAMHMSESLDRLRKVLVHIIKQNDRHLARLVHPHHNRGLPANLSDEADISQCTFKGLQTQMGMFEVYSQILANPVSTAFGVHEELNQDLTSHAMTSAILNWETLRLTRLAIATNLIASCQAIDLRGGQKLLSEPTKPLYQWVRGKVPYIKTAQPLGHHVESLAQKLYTPPITKIMLTNSNV